MENNLKNCESLHYTSVIYSTIPQLYFNEKHYFTESVKSRKDSLSRLGVLLVKTVAFSVVKCSV